MWSSKSFSNKERKDRGGFPLTRNHNRVSLVAFCSAWSIFKGPKYLFPYHAFHTQTHFPEKKRRHTCLQMKKIDKTDSKHEDTSVMSSPKSSVSSSFTSWFWNVLQKDDTDFSSSMEVPSSSLESNSPPSSSISSESFISELDGLVVNYAKTGITRNYTEIFGNTFDKVAFRVDAVSDGWGLSYANLTGYSEYDWAGQLFLATNVIYGVAGILATSFSIFPGQDPGPTGQLNYFLGVPATNSGLNFDSDPGLFLFGLAIDVAGLVSLKYHWGQLHYGADRDEVRPYLLIDYCTAALAIFTTTFTFISIFLSLTVSSSSISDMNFFNSISNIGSSGLSIATASLLIEKLQQELSLNSEIIKLFIEGLGYGALGLASLYVSWIFEFGELYLLFHGLWHIFSGLCAVDVAKLKLLVDVM